MKTDNHQRLYLIAALICVAATFRLINHPINFTPVGAMALFAGATLRDRRWAIGLPLVAMLGTDMWLGFHSTIPFVYGALALIVLVGQKIREHRREPLWVGGAALLASALFFVVTNLGVWLAGEWYPRSMAGLVDCFVMAIPFFHHTVAGDLVFSAVLFGGFALVESLVPGIDAEHVPHDAARV